MNLLPVVSARFADDSEILLQGFGAQGSIVQVVEGHPVELAAHVIHVDGEAVDLAVTLTNLADYEAPGRAPYNVHPVLVTVTVPYGFGTFEEQNDDRDPSVWGRSGEFFAAIRDARMKGVGRVETDAVETVFVLLENVPAARRPFAGFWQQQLNGSVEEDPLSASSPTLPGGRQACWRAMITNVYNRIDLDPQPDPPEEWYDETGPWPEVGDRPASLQRLIDSMTRWNTRFDAERDREIWSDGSTQARASFVNFLCTRERRWETWNRDANGDYFAPLPGQDSIHWLAWPDIWWQDGHTSCHYGLVYSVFRLWLDERRRGRQGKARGAWWLFTRLAEAAMTTGICWSADHVHEGWAWYEKSPRGGTWVYPGAYSWAAAANYKQYLLNAFAASHLEWTHVQRGVQMSVQACAERGTENWNGQWSSGRGPAWGLLDAVLARRMTGDPEWIDLIRARALNLIERSQNGSWFNPQAALQASNLFENAKAVVALQTAWREGDLDQPTRDAIADFLALATARLREKVYVFGDVTLCAYVITPEGTPGVIWPNPWDATPCNLPDTSEFSRAWVALALGIDAVVFDREESVAPFLGLSRDIGRYLDAAPNLTWDLGPPDEDNFRLATNVQVSQTPATAGPFSWWTRRGWNTVKNEAQVLLWGDAIAWLRKQLPDPGLGGEAGG